MPLLLCFLLIFSFASNRAFCQVITTFAGTEWLFPGDGRRAIDAPLAGILGMGVAADKRGNFFIADADNLMVMKVGPDGFLSVLAGNGISSHSGDGGPASNAALFLPNGVAADPNGNVYIAEYGNYIRKVAPDGTITTIAGTGDSGFSGDGGPATSATFRRPISIAVDKAGNLYVADRDNHRIRKISGGIVTTIAGTGRQDFSGDDGPATAATLDTPYGVAVDSVGNVYIADTQNLVVRKVTPAGIISTVAGGGAFGREGEPATESFLYPFSVTVDAADNLYVGDLLRSRIVRIDSAGIITTVAGNGTKGYSGDGGPATGAQINFPSTIAFDNAGNFYIADSGIGRVRKVTADGIISTVAGNGQFRTGGDGGPAASAALYLPTGLAFDANGNFYMAEPQRNRVRKVTPDCIISAVAGVVTAGGFAGDGGPAVDARLNGPYGVAADAAGNVYVTDELNHRIRRITPDGIIDTFAGNGERDSAGDGGPATKASVFDPRYMIFDRAGNLYISEGNHLIRKVTPEGIITTVAGNGRKGYSGDGGPAISASINDPYGVAIDAAGNLYIAEYGGNRIRKVDTAGVISTEAGNGREGFSGDGGPATQATLNTPAGIAVDNRGNLYIADESNYRIRKVTPDGTISTVAGTGRARFSGDGGLAVNATLSVPTAVALDGAGNLYIADWANHRFRVVLTSPPSYASFPGALSFRGESGGVASPVQNVRLSGTVPGLLFNVAVSTEDGGDWLKSTTDVGSMPAAIPISADPASLAPGSYRGTVTITAPESDPPVRAIAVSLVVDPAPPAGLSAAPDTLTFTLSQGSAALTQALTVSNEGGGSIDFSASASATSGGAWLSVSPAGGSATAAVAATVAIRANPAKLSPGTYSGVISVSSSTTGETESIPVTMTVSAIRQTIHVLQTGLTFTAIPGGGVAPRRSFGIQNIGQGSMDWSVSAVTLSGGPDWLSVSPQSGASVALSQNPPQVDVSVDTASLAAGEYYGRVQITVPGADNSPQTVSIVLNVLPAGSDPGPIVEPAGLIFTGVAGGVSPGSQNVFVSNLTAAATSFGSGRLTLDGKSWFVHLPTDATVTPDRATRIVVQPELAGLAPGVYRGALTLLFPGALSRTVSLLFVVAPASGSILLSRSFRAADAACSPTKLAPVFTTLSDNFTVAAGWPSPLEVRVVDDCGGLMMDGSAVASFSNGDPPLNLKSSRTGTWSATWQARNTKNPRATVTVKAELPDRATRGTAEVTGGLRTNESFPVIASGGVVNSASMIPKSPLAPGSLVSILGSGLATAKLSSTALPASTEMGGTSVTVAGRLLPLLNVSEDRIDAVLPDDIAVNTLHQLIVQKGNTTTLPEPLTVASAGPAIFTKDGAGEGQGKIFAVSAGGTQTLAGPGAPVRAGDSILIECTGLGAVDRPAPAGTAAPDAPAAKTMNVVTVTIGGVAAVVTFAGLEPGSTGRYQIKATAPAGMPTGDAVPVQVTVAGQTSPLVTMAIR